jgi:protein-disulfide isomerase
LPLLEAEYIDTGKVKFVAHPFYLGDPEIGRAVEAAWCAQDQGKYFEYEHALFENQGMSLSPENLVALAGELGLDQNALAQCLANGTHRNDVGRAVQAAAARGVNSTPTFFINNRRVRGNEAYEVFQRLIEQELAKAQ